MSGMSLKSLLEKNYFDGWNPDEIALLRREYAILQSSFIAKKKRCEELQSELMLWKDAYRESGKTVDRLVQDLVVARGIAYKKNAVDSNYAQAKSSLEAMGNSRNAHRREAQAQFGEAQRLRTDLAAACREQIQQSKSNVLLRKERAILRDLLRITRTRCLEMIAELESPNLSPTGA